MKLIIDIQLKSYLQRFVGPQGAWGKSGQIVATKTAVLPQIADPHGIDSELLMIPNRFCLAQIETGGQYAQSFFQDRLHPGR